MDRNAVKAKVRDLLAELLQRPGLILHDTDRAEDIDGWDSLTHMKLLVAIEDAYDIQFGVSELSAPANLGELVDLVCTLG